MWYRTCEEGTDYVMIGPCSSLQKYVRQVRQRTEAQLVNNDVPCVH